MSRSKERGRNEGPAISIRGKSRERRTLRQSGLPEIDCGKANKFGLSLSAHSLQINGRHSLSPQEEGLFRAVTPCCPRGQFNRTNNCRASFRAETRAIWHLGQIFGKQFSPIELTLWAACADSEVRTVCRRGRRGFLCECIGGRLRD